MTQRVVLFSRSFNSLLRLKYLQSSCKRVRTTQKGNVRTFTIYRSFSFDLLNTSVFNDNRRSSKQYSSFLTKEDYVKETEYLRHIFNKKFNESDTSNSDLMKSTKHLLYIYNRYRRSPTIQKDIQQFIGSEKFTVYCNFLERRLPFLESHELKMLLSFNVFGIPSSSSLMQKIYHLIIEKINEYSVTDLMDIYCKIMKDKNKTQKLINLSNICLKCFDHKLPISYDEDLNYNEVAFFCSSELPLSIRRKLMNIIYQNFNTVHSQIGLSALCQMFRAFSDPLCQKYFIPEMMVVLKEKMQEGFNFNNCVDVLFGLKYLLDKSCAYEEDFFNMLIEKNQTVRPSVFTSIMLIHKVLQMGHFCLPYIEKQEALFSDIEFIFNQKRSSQIFAKILSCVYYHPFGYRGDNSYHRECIRKLEWMDSSFSDFQDYLYWCVNMTILGSEKKLEYVNELFKFLRRASNENHIVGMMFSEVEKIISLYAFTRTHFPGEVIELPQKFLDKCYDMLKENSKPINEFLRSFIEDGMEVYENITSSNHHFINFAVLIDNNESPKKDAKVKRDVLKIEDIERSPTSKLILYQIYRGLSGCKFRNSDALPGYIQFYLQTYEQFNCKVVIIDQKHFSSLFKNKQYLYIKSKFKEGITD